MSTPYRVKQYFENNGISLYRHEIIYHHGGNRFVRKIEDSSGNIDIHDDLLHMLAIISQEDIDTTPSGWNKTPGCWFLKKEVKERLDQEEPDLIAADEMVFAEFRRQQESAKSNKALRAYIRSYNRRNFASILWEEWDKAEISKEEWARRSGCELDLIERVLGSPVNLDFDTFCDLLFSLRGGMIRDIFITHPRIRGEHT